MYNSDNEFDSIFMDEYDIKSNLMAIFDDSSIKTKEKAKEKEAPPPEPEQPPSPSRHRKSKEMFSIRKNRKKTNYFFRFPLVCAKEGDLFNTICENDSYFLNPKSAGFIPNEFWPNINISLGNIVADFFRRKNNAYSRFSHKLYNAIQISKMFPALKWFSGVEWISKDILLVNKVQFARLLGIRSIDGSLFHHQGNFTTHGFIEVSDEEATIIAGKKISRSDKDNQKLLKHKDGVFTSDATEEDIIQCKWIKKTGEPVRKPRKPKN